MQQSQPPAGQAGKRFADRPIDLCCPSESVEPEYCCTKSMHIGAVSAILQPTHRQIEQHQRMAGSTTRTSPTTDCRRHDAGNTTGGAERPWRAPTHGSTHVSGVVGGNEWSSRNWRRRRKRRRSASSRPANAASDPPNTDDSKLRQRQQQQQQNPARNVTAEPGDCTETPLVGAQSRKNGTPRASSRPADRFPAFPTTTHPAFPTWPWQLDI